MTATPKPRLGDDQRKILEYLRAAAEDGEGDYVLGLRIQLDVDVWPIRSPLDSLKRRGLVDHDGNRDLTQRFWGITDAGREALS
jgi:hypothetical protein